MKTQRKIFVVAGTLFLLVAVTLPLHPQVLRKKSAPVIAEPPVVTKKPTELVVERPEPPGFQQIICRSR